MTRPHDIPNLDPHAIDVIMADVRDYADLLKLARALTAFVADDEPDSIGARRSFRVDGTTYIVRATDHGLPGALWRLCEWMDQHRPVIVEPEIDEFDTQRVDTSGNRETLA